MSFLPRPLSQGIRPSPFRHTIYEGVGAPALGSLLNQPKEQSGLVGRTFITHIGRPARGRVVKRSPSPFGGEITGPLQGLAGSPPGPSDEHVAKGAIDRQQEHGVETPIFFRPDLE